MFTSEDNQKDFFDDYVYARRVPSTHELMKIRAAIEWSFVEEKTRGLYSENNGRPGYSPLVLFKMLFIEYYDNLSDVAVCEHMGINLLYQKFVGIGMDDEIPEPTTLVEFRNRMGEQVFKVLFDELVRQLKGKGLLSEKVASIDGTHIEADIALQGMVNLLRQGRRKLLWRVGKKNKGWQEELKKRYPSDVVVMRGKPGAKDIAEEQRVTKRFLNELAGKELGEEGSMDYEELQRLSNGEVGVISFEDKDARWGHKRKDKPFAGYKAHTSMDDSGIVTSAEVVSGETNEAGGLEGLIEDDRSKGITSERVAVDGLYDQAMTYEVSEGMKIPIYAPCRHVPKGVEKEYFFFDEKGRMRCRDYSFSYQDIQEGKRKRYNFHEGDCGECLSKGSCVKKGRAQRSIWLNKCAEESMKQDQAKRKEALEKRKRIEPKFGEAKKWHNMDRARYRGKWRVAIQVFMTYIVLNAKRAVKIMQELRAPPWSLVRVSP